MMRSWVGVSSFLLHFARVPLFLPLLVLLPLVFVGACSRSTSIEGTGDSGRDDAGPPRSDSGLSTVDSGVPPMDTGTPDSGNGYATDSGRGCETGSESCTPLATGCSATETCYDGLDNDCNLLVDDGCPCVPGTVQTCFLGPPGSRDVGACRDGTQRCEGTAEFGSWGPCGGGISPSAETCDLLDNDCNGCADEHECCGGDLNCPGPGDPRVPSGRPFHELMVDGTTIFLGAAVSWRWEIQGGPCEPVIPGTTFATGDLTDSMLRFTPSLSGDYTVTMHVRTATGEDLTCTFVVHVAGDGLRIELCWQPTVSGGTSDLDLYLHEPDTTGPWYAGSSSVTSPGVTTGNSCNWANCAPGLRTALPRANWGYPASTLDHCDRGPGGAGWSSLGSCPNPRIDVDGHGRASEPLHGFLENLNADNPRDGQSFRVMVHDCQGPSSNPLVNIYCGGFLRATLGAAPDTITLPGGWSCSAGTDPVWRVADVTVHVDAAGVTTGCDVTPLREADGSPRVTRGDLAY